MKNSKKKPPGLSVAIKLCLASFLTLMAFPVFAFNTYLNEFNTHYGTLATRIDSCGLCHVDFNGGGQRTSYGEDYRNNNYSAASIGILDSDGDGFTNDQEAAASTLTHPGYSCNEQFSVINAPANIADFLDPSNPGCIGPGQSPIANANGPYSGVSGEFISFSSAGSSDPDGTIVSYFWDFGSFGSSVEANPQFSFSITFNAKISFTLTVVDNDGNQTSTTSTIVILLAPNSPPVANVNAGVTGSANSQVSFSAAGSLDPEGDRLTYAWDFGDQTAGVGGEPSHTYARCGTYDVTLTVFDSFGLEDSATTTATISGSGVNPPTANAGGVAGTYNGTLASNVQFDGSASTDSDCDIVNYSWDFGDGTTGVGAAPLHAYALAGGYVATLTVTDTDGLMTSSSVDVTIVDTGPIDGQTLYDSNCGNCHGFGTATTKPGATVARIDAGIATVPSMASLSTLSVAEVQAIADFLATITPPPPPPPPPGPIDGAASYDTNCGSCHGFGTATTKPGASVARIDAGIATVPSMASLSTLSVAEVQAIADFLATVTPPPPPPPPPGPIDGAASYDTNCGSCHGYGTATTKPGATVARIDAGIATVPSMASLSTLSVAEVQAIADFLATVTPPPPPPPPPGPIDGAASYDTNCGSCHGFGTATTKPGASVARIDAGIATVPSMASLSVLSTEEIQAIADFLATVTPPPPPPPPPGPIDGAASYDTNCGSCHGFGINSGKAGATVARIDAGIANVPSMASLSTLGATEIQAISDFLMTLSAPTTPEGLYATHCGSCHGADGSGGTSGVNVIGDSANSISSAIEQEQEMQNLSFLTVSEIQAISDFLNGVVTPPPPPPGTGSGEVSYDANCGSCHGFGANSGKAGATVARINNGIATVASMNSLSSLPAAEIQLISDFLMSLSVPTTPEGLYATHCGSCHGADGSGGSSGVNVIGDSANSISSAIESESEMQSLSFLSSGEIQLISDFLNGVVTPPPPPGPVDGGASYDANCGSCHGFGAATTKPGATVARIDAGIATVPSMASLSVLSAVEVQAIADFLASVAQPPPPPGTGNGEASYDTNCGSCHGFGANSGKAGATVARINGGIVNVPSMASLSTLPASEIQLISDFLMSLSAPTTPEGLYATHCGSCHGADGSGGSSGENVIGDSASKISSAIEKEREMQSLGFLTTGEVQLISDFLNGVTSPPPASGDGSALYDINCAGCHGLGSNSEKAGATAARINSGIANESSMNFFSNTLTSAEVQAIADFLTTTSAPETPKAKYLAYCGSCHGSDGMGGSSDKKVIGDDKGDIKDAIEDEDEMNFLDFLSGSDIEDIADYLQVLKDREED